MKIFQKYCALFLIAGIALCAQVARAGDAEAREKMMALERDIHQSFKDKKYEVAVEKCREQLKLAPKYAGAYYNLACAQSRLGKKDDAIASLSSAIDNGYEDIAHMKVDDDLAAVRDDKRFTDLAARAIEKERNGNYEKGAEIPGVKTVEDYPEGGLRFRLRMSEDATPQKPNRLVIWLHPSGGSMNNVAESLAPQLAKQGYALLVMTKKNWMGWSGEDAEKLMNKTLPAVAKIPGISEAKPILLGYSAGGQIALQLWNQAGAKFGGLVLDAAYPIDMAKYAKGQAAAQELPKDEAIRKVPMFVLVGGADGGSQIWKQCEESWRKSGVPLTITYIPGKGHTWLFGQPEVDSMLKWMKDVAPADGK